MAISLDKWSSRGLDPGTLICRSIDGAIWLQEDNGDSIGFNVTLHLPVILCLQYPDVDGLAMSLWTILGRIPDTQHNVRGRGHACCIESLPDEQRQHMLAHWSTHQRCCHPCFG